MAPTDSVRPVLVVCEGIRDALTDAQAGYRAVAVLGSQAPHQSVANRLVVHADQHGLAIVAIQDGDPAGRVWADRLGHFIAERDHNLQVIEPPMPGADLNDWARGDPDWSQRLPGNGIDRQPRPPFAPTWRTPRPGFEIV